MWFLLLLLLLCVTSSQGVLAQRNIVPAFVEPGVFAGRTPDVMVADAREIGVELADSVLVSSPNAAAWLVGSGDDQVMEDTHVADLVLRTLNSVPMHRDVSGPAFLKTHSLSHAKANALVVVQDMTLDASRGALRAMADLTMPLKTASYRSDFVARVASLACGQSPKVHGIVSRQWLDSDSGEMVVAYEDVDSEVPASAAADATATQCFSYDAAAARAFCVGRHDDDVHIVDSKKAVDFAAFLDNERVMEAFSEAGVSVTLLEDDSAIVVEVAHGDAVEVPLNNDAGFSFWSELEFMWTEMAGKTVATDRRRSHVYAFVLTGLRRVGDAFGSDSSIARACEAVVDAFVPALLSEVARVEQNKVINEVILLQRESETINLPLNMVTVDTGVRGALYAAERTPEAAVRLCEEAVSTYHALSRAQMQVYCFAREAQAREAIARRRLLASSTQDGENGNAANKIKPDDVQRWQIAAWYSILMFFVLYFALYSVGFMELKEDSLLYSVLPSQG